MKNQKEETEDTSEEMAKRDVVAAMVFLKSCA